VFYPGSGPVKNIAICVLAVVLTVACATQENRGDPALLEFITIGQTTRTEVVLRLGKPSASFEDERILTYRIGGDSSNGYFVRDAAGSWYETSYSLVLVFGSGGVLENQSLVRVH
jgi:hypothetical protein